jgi:hypothetical protein
MTDFRGPEPSGPDRIGVNSAASRPATSKVAGIDLYTWRARIAPAVLASLPLLSLGVLVLPLLKDGDKLWSLASVAVTTFAALAARRAGNRIQPSLIEAWSGWPTTVRLQYRSATSPQEIARRHGHMHRILGADLDLPDADHERADLAGADRIYADAMKRIVPLVRGNPEFRLLNVENRNFGYARNLLGLRPFGLGCAALSLVISAAVAGVLVFTHSAVYATGLLLPALVSLVALALWTQVDADYVRPSAEAYADRVVEALEGLPSATDAGRRGGRVNDRTT